MMRRSWCVVALVALLVASAVHVVRADAGRSPQSQSTLAGHWSGHVSLPAGPLAIAVVFHQDVSGTLSGTIDIPAQGARGVALSNIVVVGRDVRFAMAGRR